MKILFWMSTGFQTTSRHLLIPIVESLCTQENEVVILKKTTDSEEDDFPQELKDLSVVCKNVKVKKASKNNLVFRFLYDVLYVMKCKKHIERGYDAVFVQSTNVAWLVIHTIRKKNPKAKITFNIQDMFPQNALYGGKLNNSSVIYKSLAGIQRYAYKKTDNIITISEDMKDALVSEGVDSSKIEVIYNWSYRDVVYSHDEIDFSAVSHMFNENYFNVVYAGNIGVMQNVDVVIEAAKLMKSDDGVWFHIIGDGVYKEKLKKDAEAYGIANITFWPALESKHAPAVYASAGVNIIPLVKNVYKTALPSKTATCFACGRPIIMCIGKDSKFAQMAHNETGCCILESDDAEGLASAILKHKQNSNTEKYDEFFSANLKKTNNSEKYADIITRNIVRSRK